MLTTMRFAVPLVVLLNELGAAHARLVSLLALLPPATFTGDRLDKLTGAPIRVPALGFQASQALRLHLGRAGDGVRLQHAVLHDAQTARAFRDEDGSIGQERHAKGLREAFGDHDLERAFDARFERDGAVRDHRRGPGDSFGRDASSDFRRNGLLGLRDQREQRRSGAEEQDGCVA